MLVRYGLEQEALSREKDFPTRPSLLLTIKYYLGSKELPTIQYWNPQYDGK